MNSYIVLSDALERIGDNEYYKIVGKFMIRYGDPHDDVFVAAVWLIKGCKYSVAEVARILKEQFPRSSSIEVRDEPWFEVMHIDLDWSDMRYEWNDHYFEFQKRVVSTLELMSLA